MGLSLSLGRPSGPHAYGDDDDDDDDDDLDDEAAAADDDDDAADTFSQCAVIFLTAHARRRTQTRQEHKVDDTPTRVCK